jgi:hypothetical protein
MGFNSLAAVGEAFTRYTMVPTIPTEYGGRDATIGSPTTSECLVAATPPLSQAGVSAG